MFGKSFAHSCTLSLWSLNLSSKSLPVPLSPKNRGTSSPITTPILIGLCWLGGLTCTGRTACFAAVHGCGLLQSGQGRAHFGEHLLLTRGPVLWGKGALCVPKPRPKPILLVRHLLLLVRHLLLEAMHLLLIASLQYIRSAPWLPLPSKSVIEGLSRPEPSWVFKASRMRIANDHMLAAAYDGSQFAGSWRSWKGLFVACVNAQAAEKCNMSILFTSQVQIRTRLPFQQLQAVIKSTSTVLPKIAGGTQQIHASLPSCLTLARNSRIPIHLSHFNGRLDRFKIFSTDSSAS